MATSGIAKCYLERDGLKWHHNFKFTRAQSDFCTQYVFRKCMYICKRIKCVVCASSFVER